MDEPLTDEEWLKIKDNKKKEKNKQEEVVSRSKFEIWIQTKHVARITCHLVY